MKLKYKLIGLAAGLGIMLGSYIKDLHYQSDMIKAGKETELKENKIGAFYNKKTAYGFGAGALLAFLSWGAIMASYDKNQNKKQKSLENIA